MTHVKFGIQDKMNFIYYIVVTLLSFSSSIVLADWPQFLGPERNGSQKKAVVPLTFKGGEPFINWKHDIGFGFSGPVVSGRKVFIFHREKNKCVIESLDLNTGKSFWSFDYDTDYVDDFGFDKGPRAVPLIKENKIYTYGAEGMLHALDLETGKLIWKKNLRDEHGATKGFFGRACSPIIIDDTLIIQAGGKGCGILGLNPKTGNIQWKLSDHEAGYASPVATKIKNQKLAICFTRHGFLCIDPKKGEIIIEKENRAEMNASVNAASPVVIENNKIFLSACYGVGASLWLIDIENKRIKELWQTNDNLDCHYATPVLFDGHLIGYHGRQETGTQLRCIDVKNGKIKWQSAQMPAGTVILSGKTLIILSERGELILASANTEEFKISARGQILGAETRAMPALSDGYFLARDKRKLVSIKFNP